MRVKWFEVENILSIGKARLELKETGLTLIDGWNMDDDCANGAGKTSLPNALSFGLFNKIPRKITASDILRKGTKKGLVRTCVEKNGVEWIIERGRPKYFKVFKNGDEVDITQEELETNIGISYQQFLISMYSSQTESQKLISLNDTQTKDFFLQLLNLNAFSSAKKNADTAAKELRKEIENIEKNFVSIKSTAEANMEHLVDEKDLEYQISQIDLKSHLDQISELEKIERPDISKYEELNDKLYAKMRILDSNVHKKTNLENKLNSAKQVLVNLQSYAPSINNQVECPHCDGVFGLDHSGVHTTESLQKEHETKIEAARCEVEALIQELTQIPDDTEERSKLKKIKSDLSTRKDQEMVSYDTTQKQIVSYKIAYESDKTNLNHLKIKLDQNSKIKAKIADCKLQMKTLKSQHGEKKADLEIYEEISQMFSPTGAPAYVMDSIVDVFNEKMEGYVNMVWPRALYKISTSKENKTGEVRAKFSQDLVINGENMSIGSLSGGEHKCLSLCMDFAIVDVLQSMFGSSLNPIIMDEPFDGLDSSNREKVVELLEKLSVDRNIIVIDHASEAKSMFSDIIKVVKKNGISEIA